MRFPHENPAARADLDRNRARCDKYVKRLTTIIGEKRAAGLAGDELYVAAGEAAAKVLADMAIEVGSRGIFAFGAAVALLGHAGLKLTDDPLGMRG